MVKQMELIPRPRVRLDEPARPRTRLDAAVDPLDQNSPSELDIDPLTHPSYALGMPKPEPAVIPLNVLNRSNWSRGGEKPPVTGWWEVTDHKTGTLLTRWWYDGDWSKGDPKDKMSTRLTHAQFVTQYAWRGMCRPHEDVYPCPPYVSTDLVTRARAVPVSILTTYIRFRVPTLGPGVAETVNAPQWPNGRPRVKL